jgi:exopolyphosphatase/guanosine-5'-triphosphate,3'-diphosphate pyrophosphatase
MRVAAIDIGTNSVLLLIAESRGADVVALVERAVITRLGQGVDATRTLAPQAVARTLDCLADYAEQIRALGVERIDAVGTSAMRDAGGGEEFVARARDILGVAPRVISGREEAELTFEGALLGLDLPPSLWGLDADRLAHSHARAVTVFDVGGGSTEIILGDASGKVDQAFSLDVGSVRLTERHIRTDPPRPEEIDAVRMDVRRALASAPARPDLSVPSVVVGVAGTVTTLAALIGDVIPYDGARVHGSRMRRADLSAALLQLGSLSLAERRALAAIDPARADVIVAGAVLVEEVVAWARPGDGRAIDPQAVDLIASDRGVRWGVARRIL